MPGRITMYSRRICGLCDRAREVLLSVRAELPFEYEEVLVDGDEALEREYGVRVPVVLLNGVERFEVEVPPDELRSLLASGA
jgi:glutaredoxin